jgi:glycogen synthase
MFTDTKMISNDSSFQIATLDWIIGRDEMPDVINCHDHHTGLIPFMMLYCGKYRKLQNTPSMITIHNGLYQGQFGFDKLHYLPEFDLCGIRMGSLYQFFGCRRKVRMGSDYRFSKLFERN